MKRIDKYKWNYNASIERENLNLDKDGYIDIEKVLSIHNDFTLMYREMSENISGMSVKDGNNKIIVVNSSLSKGRQRFTIAHELCHLLYHEGDCFVCSKNKVKEDMEKEADLFASYFLAPMKSFNSLFLEYFNKYGSKFLSTIILENIFGISHLATLLRLKEENLITLNEYEEYKEEKPSKHAIFLGYDIDLYLPTNVNKVVGKYIKLAIELNEKELISQGKYEELLLSAFREDLVYGEISYGSID